MASMAEKLRARRAASKAGRPKKQDAERYPSGQIKKAWTEKEAKSVVIEARARIHVIADNGKEGIAGYTAGRMALDGKISAAHLEIGNEYAERYFRYLRSTGVPCPSARAQIFGRVRGHDGDPTDDAIKRARIATAAMVADQTTLLSCIDGPQVKALVFNLFVMDEENLRMVGPQQLIWIRRGLNALIKAKDLRTKGRQAMNIPTSDVCLIG